MAGQPAKPSAGGAGPATSDDPAISYVPGSEHIEVTSEMIEAGVSVLAELGGDSLKETLASAVYRAMAMAYCGHSQQED